MRFHINETPRQYMFSDLEPGDLFSFVGQEEVMMCTYLSADSPQQGYVSLQSGKLKLLEENTPDFPVQELDIDDKITVYKL